MCLLFMLDYSVYSFAQTTAFGKLRALKTLSCSYIPLPLESRIPAIEKVRIFESVKTTPTSSSGSVFADRICGLFLRHLSNFQLSPI